MREKSSVPNPVSVLLRIGSTYLLMPRDAVDAAVEVTEKSEPCACGYITGVGEVFYPSPYTTDKADIRLQRVIYFPSYEEYRQVADAAEAREKAEREARAKAKEGGTE